MQRTRFALPLLIASLAFGQATVEPVERANDALRPAPAAERLSPELDAWWQDAVFYEVFVRSFADASAGPLAGDGVGDFRGLIERLDYLNDGDPSTDDDLGVTALWLMPITESPSYHGYDTTDYRLIDPDYGSNEDFLAFMEACRARGIRVTIDLVLNHCSSRHPWFEAAANGDPSKRDWFIWQDEHPGWRGPWGQPVWHASPGSAPGFYYGLFWSGMPDLNYENPAVTAKMFDVTGFWLEDMGVDGFRLDAIRHLIEDGRVQDNTPATHAWLRGFFDHVKSVKPDAVTVGEVWAGSDDVSRYVGDQMDIAFEFQLADAILASVREGVAGPMLGQLEVLERLYPLGMYATFLRNHDQPRTLHELGGDREAAKLAASIQFALPGVPFIYYGEEIGMTATKPDPEIRTPMQWSSGENAGFSDAEPWIGVKPDYRDVNVAAQDRDPSSLLERYRRLVRARLATTALRTGDVTRLEASDPSVLAFVRGDPADGGVLCVFNLSSEPLSGVRLRGGEGFDPDATLGFDLLGPAVGVRAGAPLPVLVPRSAHYFPLSTR